MRALLDVNLLIALHDRQHVHHEPARDWFAANAASGWASCPLTQNGALRIMSQPAYPQAVPLAALMAMFARSYSDAAHAFWPDDISLIDPRRFDVARIHGPRQLTDLYLLALAVAHGGRLATLDARIPRAAVHGAAARHLVQVTAS